MQSGDSIDSFCTTMIQFWDVDFNLEFRLRLVIEKKKKNCGGKWLSPIYVKCCSTDRADHDNAVGVMTRPKAGRSKDRISILGKSQKFIFQNIPTGYNLHPLSPSMGTGSQTIFIR
jgi:hypothetical protein